MSKNFKEVQYTRVDLDSPNKEDHPDTNLEFAEDHEIEQDSQLPEEPLRKDEGNRSVLSFAFYQKFFDVNTRDVLFRILGSFVVRPKMNFVCDDIRKSPDLYGPFWVTTTLVFTTAIAGNMANFFAAAGSDYQWVYDFKKVTFAAAAIYSYWWILPLFLWAFLRWRKASDPYSFLELLCLYGYCLSVYVPISILWVIPVNALQWILVVLGLITSGSVLVRALWPPLALTDKKAALIMLSVVICLHALLAIGFMLYFFHVPSQNAKPHVSTISATTTTPLPPSTKL